MISFTELSSDNIDTLSDKLKETLRPSDEEYFADVLSSLLETVEEDPDTGVGVSGFGGCLLARIFDYGRYMFIYPIAQRDDADLVGAVDAISAYAVKEEIPLVFTDVPSDEVHRLVGRYRHLSLDAEDVDASSYRVSVHGECEILKEIPDVELDRVRLNSPSPEDIPDIARLARDESVNKYWGYSYLSDIGDVADEYFYESSMRAFEEGVSMSMAIRYSGRYVGEAEFYSFDLRGGAEIAIRLLPEWQGQGLGKETLALAIKLARHIGLSTLYGRVMEQNEPSIRFMSSLMTEYKREDGTVYFVKDL